MEAASIVDAVEPIVVSLHDRERALRHKRNLLDLDHIPENNGPVQPPSHQHLVAVPITYSNILIVLYSGLDSVLKCNLLVL